MINYTIYNTTTGLIHTTGTSSCNSINDIVLNSGDSIIEGTYRQDAYKIVNGKAESYTPNFLNRLRKSWIKRSLSASIIGNDGSKSL